MNVMEQELSKRIISGVNYLALEAHNSGAYEIARILKLCMKDICISVEKDLPHDMSSHHLLNSDFYTVIQFLSQYASIRDEDLKRDILQRIQEVEEKLN